MLEIGSASAVSTGFHHDAGAWQGKVAMSANQSPIFRVTVLRSGYRSGVLFEKRIVLGGPVSGAYCYFDNEKGILPTDVPALCGYAHYAISPNAENQWVLAELTAFAESVRVPADAHAIRPLQRTHVEKGHCEFRECLRHFAERGPSQLKEFFGGYAGFRARILAPREGGQEVVGKTEFRVCRPQDLIPVCRPRFLHKCEDILRVKDPQRPGWFAKTGPMRADFIAARVYPRTELLQRLRRAVFEHPFFVLVGDIATGKTVLARNLVHQLYEEGRRDIFWHFHSESDIASLAAEINDLSGLIVIEDIHIDPPRYQQLYRYLRADPNRNVLFIARPSFREYQNSRLSPLDELPAETLAPSDHVDEILAHCARVRCDRALSDEERQAIKGVSQGNLWLLTYALDGFLECGGQGPPRRWLTQGVQADLRDLSRQNLEYPEILVSLAPLYKFEVFTAESFLVDTLHLSTEALDRLAAAGEITVQMSTAGHVLYGLPHAALADAYWEHGQLYRARRRLPDRDQFLYQYASANLPNSLSAVVKSSSVIECQVLARLAAEGLLARIVRAEESPNAVFYLLLLARSNKLRIDVDVLSVMVDTMNAASELACTFIALVCVDEMWGQDVGHAFWERLQFARLAHRIVRHRSVRDIDEWLAYLREKHFEAAVRLVHQLDMSELAARVDESVDGPRCIMLLANLEEIDQTRGEALWTLVDPQKLARDLASRPLNVMVDIVAYVSRVRPSWAVDLCRNIPIEEVAARVNNNEDNEVVIGLAIQIIQSFDEDRGRALLNMVKNEQLKRALAGRLR